MKEDAWKSSNLPLAIYTMAINEFAIYTLSKIKNSFRPIVYIKKYLATKKNGSAVAEMS